MKTIFHAMLHRIPVITKVFITFIKVFITFITGFFITFIKVFITFIKVSIKFIKIITTIEFCNYTQSMFLC